MADVQSHPEVNRLHIQSDPPAEKSTNDLIDANVAAAVTNAQAAPSANSKQVADMPAAVESSSLVESAAPELGVTDTQSVPNTNGDSVTIDATKPEPQVNGHTAIVQAEASPAPQSAPSLQATASFSESVVPSSIPSEIPSSYPAVEMTETPAAPLLEPVISPEQAPTSDLRTIPHSDNLAPERVAAIEERKHTEDNNADLIGTPANDAPSPAPLSVPAPISTITGLPSPPAQLTPPTAPAILSASLVTENADVPMAEGLPASVSSETQAEPDPVPAVPAPVVEDTVMEDAPTTEGQPPPSLTIPTEDLFGTTKVSREREDTEDDEPMAKRVRTEEPSNDQAGFKVPEPPSTTSAHVSVDGANGVNLDGDDSVTPARLVQMKKTISNLKKSKASTAFRLPVDPVALNVPTYFDIVKHPMDLGLIDTKLKQNEYNSVNDFIADFNQIVRNCVLFNGTDHTVTQAAFTMQNSFNSQMSNLPSAKEVEPSKAEKKAMKLKMEPMRTAPPRRPSVTTPGSARSPKSAATASTPSFAPGPDGMPLIRRDSNMVDGRPKRAIVPPKRNSDFAGVRPKKKKYELQLKFCQDVLKDIASAKHWQLNQYFTHPVDPVALNIPTYFQVIKKPMDLGTVQQKLDNNVYEKAKDFEEDVRLIFKNCYKFNPEGDYVYKLGRDLERLFDQRWAEKDEWIAAREPQSEPQSEGDEEDDDEGSEDEEPDSEDDRNEKIKMLQAQIEAMSKQMGELTQSKKKKKVTPPVDKKKAKSKPKKEKAAAQFPGLSKTKDKKKNNTKQKAEKDRYVTFQEKQYISNGIAMLPEKQMQEALRIIQSSVPALANSNENEIELDIEEVPNHALLKLLAFVRKYAPLPQDEQEIKSESFSAAPSKSKKNKPMSKTQQEAQIEELKGRLGAYGGPVSPDALQSVETGNDSSDDSADSEESEEE